MSFLSEKEDDVPTITTLKILIIGESGVGKSRYFKILIKKFIILILQSYVTVCG